MQYFVKVFAQSKKEKIYLCAHDTKVHFIHIVIITRFAFQL